MLEDLIQSTDANGHSKWSLEVGEANIEVVCLFYERRVYVASISSPNIYFLQASGNTPEEALKALVETVSKGILEAGNVILAIS